jgi:hypothetical protein
MGCSCRGLVHAFGFSPRRLQSPSAAIGFAGESRPSKCAVDEKRDGASSGLRIASELEFLPAAHTATNKRAGVRA